MNTTEIRETVKDVIDARPNFDNVQVWYDTDDGELWTTTELAGNWVRYRQDSIHEIYPAEVEAVMGSFDEKSLEEYINNGYYSALVF